MKIHICKAHKNLDDQGQRESIDGPDSIHYDSRNADIPSGNFCLTEFLDAFILGVSGFRTKGVSDFIFHT